MIEIYILRHAIAKSREDWRGKPDPERPLTTKGEKKMAGEARAMRAAGLKFDLIVSSPFARASRTAEIVARALCIRRKLKFCQSLTPSSQPKRFLSEIVPDLDARRRILVVGHEPHLSKLISVCLSGDSSLQILLKKGGLCKLSSESRILAGHCVLEWLLTPDQVLALG